MFSKYYKILGLEEGASKDEIKNAYRLLAKKHHPDISDEADAHERFIEITEAYEILINRQVIDDLRFTRANSEERSNTYSYLIRQARETARKASEMRYERLREEHEAFQKSGMYDVMLLLNYAFNFLLIIFALFLIVFPVYIAVKVHFFGLVFFWVPGIFIVLYIKGKGRSYFRLGSFFYNINEIRQLIKNESGSGSLPCAYSRNRPADAYPYKLSLLKVHDINLHFAGALQHNVTYKRSYQKIKIPRSKKAYRMHTTGSIIKVLGIIAGVIFAPFDSLLWRILTGVVAGGFLSGLVLGVSGIRSKVSYLLNVNLLVKILAWMLVILLFTDFSSFPNLVTSDYILVGLVSMLFFQDILLDPLVRLFTRKGKQQMPILTQPEQLQTLYMKGYQPYLEIPVWSTVFPILKWLF